MEGCFMFQWGGLFFGWGALFLSGGGGAPHGGDISFGGGGERNCNLWGGAPMPPPPLWEMLHLEYISVA